MSGPWPQIIICTNFSSLALLANCSSSDKSPPLQARQPTLLHLWLSFSQTREILRRGAKTRYNASCERVNGAGTPRGEGGCYVRSYVVTRKEGECGGGGGDHTGETLYNVRTNLRWEGGGAGWPIWWADTRPSAHQEMLDTFQENNQQYWLLVCLTFC